MKKHFWSALTILSVLIPLLTFGGFAYLFMQHRELVEQYKTPLISFGILCFLLLCFRPLFNRFYLKYKEMDDYDEFGRPTRRSRYDLSKEERDRLDLEKMADMERILGAATLKKLTHKGSTDTSGDMKKLTGLKPVKHKMKEMVARMKFEKEAGGSRKEQKSSQGRHMVFYGAPGTGKTTVARILTGFLHKYGYIKKNNCLEVDGNFLKAATPSDTATKVRLIVRHAAGGVLFVDEAYALKDNGDGCGREAIATLIKEMEDHRDEFVLILAGYTDEMKELLDANPGFHSRIKEYLDFPNYTMEELKKIFRYMAGEAGFAVNDEAYESFEIRMAKERKLPSFGNARTVRNILDEAIDLHSHNFMNKKISKDARYMITGEDVRKEPDRHRI